MSFRSLMASVSHLRKRVSVAASFSVGIKNDPISFNPPTASSSFALFSTSAQRIKDLKMSKWTRRRLYEELFLLCKEGFTVEQVLDRMWIEEGPSVEKNLVRWAKLFMKNWGKYQQALEIYEWMMRRKMTLSPANHGVHIDLIARIKGLAAAENYFNNLDASAKNYSTYRKLLKWYCRGIEEDKAKALFKKMDELGLLISCSPFNDMMTLYMGLGQHEKVAEMVGNMRRRNINLNAVSYGNWVNTYDKLDAIDDKLDAIDDMLYHGHTGFYGTMSMINECGFIEPLFYSDDQSNVAL